jgi:hypothetical protein
MGITPLGCFCSKRRFENQKPTKTKKHAFDLFCTQRTPIIELVLDRP